MRITIYVKTYSDDDKWREVTEREIDMTVSDVAAQNIELGQTVDAMIAGSVTEHIKKQSEPEPEA